jgi:hypothetical protein
MEKRSEVGIELLQIIHINFGLRRVNETRHHTSVVGPEAGGGGGLADTITRYDQVAYGATGVLTDI